MRGHSTDRREKLEARVQRGAQKSAVRRCALETAALLWWCESLQGVLNLPRTSEVEQLRGVASAPGRVQISLRGVAYHGYGMGPPPVHPRRRPILHREVPTCLTASLPNDAYIDPLQ